ncbi:MAG: branched-chain amino acid ABC transporter permease [Rectinema sp.]
MKNPTKWAVPLVFVAAAALLPLAGKALPAIAGDYPLSLARSVFTYMALAVSWDMLLRSGQVSFGIAGFYGIGVYAAALSVLRAGFSPLASILFAGIIAGFIAFLLGFVILRLRAIYFSITTLALGEIFRIILHNGGEFTGGAEGVIIPRIISNNSAVLYWLSLAGVLIAIGMSAWFERSKIRFALTAIRNNELAAKSSGIGIFKYMMIAFVATSFIQGIIGGIQLQGYGVASPSDSFSGDYTLLPLAMALLGGIHSTSGPIIGAILLGVASEFLKLKIPYGHLIVYGFIIVLVILLMPQGLYGLWRNKARARRVSRIDSGQASTDAAARAGASKEQPRA